MDFELDETARLVAQTARDLAKARIAPRAAAMERAEAIDDEVLRALSGVGLLGVNLPESLGGAEAGVVAYALAMMEVAGACASTAVTMAVTNMVGEVIAKFGTEAQKNEHCPKLCDGTYRAGAFGLSEAEAGSDPAGMRTTARRDGDGWVLDGTKQWITSGAFAGVVVVWARTAGPEAGSRGITCFLVRGGTPGMSAVSHEDKLGLRASNTAVLSFEGCRVPDSDRLGEVGSGFPIAMMALDGGRIGIGSQAIGIAEAALAEAVEYAKSRRQFGQSLDRFQALQWFVADSRAELDAARALVLRAAWLKQMGRPFSREASMGKLFASEAAWRVCNRALQIHGGYGYMRDFAVERHLRDVRVTQIYEGTSEIQRLVIARTVLKG
ncbi:MAG: acyl-CoA dehydrogenase family protein [Deltaproteobacteria bacterium]|nr:acyl-CoA dehydrogenase family protein [Deltaproteobacteria bacterium]